MKTIKRLFTLSLLTMPIVLTSCNSESEEQLPEESNGSSIEVNIVESNKFLATTKNVGQLMNSYRSKMSRTTDVEEANEATMELEQSIATECADLVDCGREVVESVIEASNNPDDEFSLSDEELMMLTDMTEPELAELGMIISASGLEDKLAEMDGCEITMHHVVDCLKLAVIGDISVMTVDIMTAIKTANKKTYNKNGAKISRRYSQKIFRMVWRGNNDGRVRSVYV